MRARRSSRTWSSRQRRSGRRRSSWTSRGGQGNAQSRGTNSRGNPEGQAEELHRRSSRSGNNEAEQLSQGQAWQKGNWECLQPHVRGWWQSVESRDLYEFCHTACMYMHMELKKRYNPDSEMVKIQRIQTDFARKNAKRLCRFMVWHLWDVPRSVTDFLKTYWQHFRWRDFVLTAQDCHDIGIAVKCKIA